MDGFFTFIAAAKKNHIINGPTCTTQDVGEMKGPATSLKKISKGVKIVVLYEIAVYF